MRQQPELPTLWTAGSGPYATVSWCSPGVTILYHETLAAAEQVAERLWYSRCGSECTKEHQVLAAARREAAA